MQSSTKVRRVLIAAGSALAMAVPMVGAGAAQASLLPLHLQTTVNAGTLHVFAGPAGKAEIAVDAKATVGVDVNALNPLFVAVVPQLCPSGEVGVLLRVLTLGSPVSADITITPLGLGTTTIPVSIGKIDTGEIGVCAPISIDAGLGQLRVSNHSGATATRRERSHHRARS
jgi:hypothetical protein